MSLLSALPRTRRKPPVLVVAGVATLALTATAVLAGPPKAEGAIAPDAKVPPTVGVGSNPIDIAIAPQKAEAYVLNDGSVSVVNLKTRKEVAEVGTGFTDQSAIGVANGGNRAYIGTFDENEVKVFNTNTRRVMDSIRVGYGASGITRATTRNGQFVYVGLLKAEKVAVINTANRKVVKRIPTKQGAQTVATTPNGKQVWVGSSYDGHVWVVDTATQRIVRTVSVPDSGPVQSIAFAPGGNTAWVSGLGGVTQVSVNTGKPLAFVPAPYLFPKAQDLNISSIAVVDGGRVVLVVNSTFPDNPGQGAVAVLGAKSLKLRRDINVGTEPQGMAVDRARRTTYVTNYMDDTVSYFPSPGRR